MHVNVYVSMYIFVSYVFTLVHLLLVVCVFCSILVCFLKGERQKGVEVGSLGVGQDLEGVGGGKTILRIYHTKKSFFNLKKKQSQDLYHDPEKQSRKNH